MDETYEKIELVKKREELGHSDAFPVSVFCNVVTVLKMMKVAEEKGITDDAGLVELEEYKEFKKVEDELKKLF